MYCYTLDTKLKKETFSFNVISPKIQGLRYCEINQDYLDTFSDCAREFHKELHVQITDVLVNYDKIMTDEERIALKQVLMAIDCLFQKNNAYAVALLKDAAAVIDLAKVLLAYCYRYGIGTGTRETTAKILLDLGCDKDERRTIDRELKNIYREVKLGL